MTAEQWRLLGFEWHCLHDVLHQLVDGESIGKAELKILIAV